MNWRRGLLLAGIHLAAAVPLILGLEADDLRSLEGYREDFQVAQAEAAKKPPERTDERPQQGETVSFDPCEMIIDPQLA